MGGCNGGRGYTKWGRWVGLDSPVVYRLGDGWVAWNWCCFVLGRVVGVLWGDSLGYEFLCHDVGLGYGVCSLVGVSYVIRWVFDAEWGSCRGGVLLMYR